MSGVELIPIIVIASSSLIGSATYLVRNIKSMKCCKCFECNQDVSRDGDRPNPREIQEEIQRNMPALQDFTTQQKKVHWLTGVKNSLTPRRFKKKLENAQAAKEEEAIEISNQRHKYPEDELYIPELDKTITKVEDYEEATQSNPVKRNNSFS